MPESFTVTVADDATVSARLYTASPGTTRPGALILAHGAGAPQLSPFMTEFARGLATRGVDVVTFNFVYMEQRRRVPDRAPRLEACYRAVIDATRARVTSAAERLVVGGKSMGGRIASQVVAAAEDGAGVAGLVFLGYPLHPPGRPEKRRDAHLPQISAPMLFVQGSRDAFGNEEEIRQVVARCQKARLFTVAGGDHSLKVRRKDGVPQDEIYTAAMDEIAAWILEGDRR